MSSLALGFIAELDPSPGVNRVGLSDDITIAGELGNVSTRVGQGNVIDFIGVQPDFALSAF